MIKVMIIDDETQITSMLDKALSKNGQISTVTYNNPEHALSALGSLDVDVILLDIMMPQMDGLAALDVIKQKHPDIKVIMMTAYSTLDRVLGSHKLGASDFLLKPFESLAEVEAKVLQVASSSK